VAEELVGLDSEEPIDPAAVVVVVVVLATRFYCNLL